MRALFWLFFVLLSTHQPARAGDIVWVTTDFSTGGIALQDAGECTAREVGIPVPGDAAVQSWGGYIFVVGRLGFDHITVCEATQPDVVLSQYSTGNGTNPQDIAPAAPGRAFVTLFERSHVLVIDPLTGGSLGTVDIALFADPDGIPEATRIVRHDDRVYVVCQRLDRSTPMMDPAGPGCLAVLEAATGAVVDADPSTPAIDPIWLPSSNPTDITQAGADLYLACTGSWSLADDGAVVHVDLRTGQTRIVAEEQDLGANLSGLAVWGSTAFVAVSYPDWSNAVIPCDLASGTWGAPIEGTSGGYIPDLLAHDGVLYVADQGTWSDPGQAGVLLVDAATEGPICGPVSTGLPPFAGAAVTPAEAETAPTTLAMRVQPNPTSDYVEVNLSRPCAGGLVTLHDLAGRTVGATRLEGDEVFLDLRADHAHVAPGAYVVRFAGCGVHLSQPLIVR